jgi:uncharacterized protein (DUF433 family)
MRGYGKLKESRATYQRLDLSARTNNIRVRSQIDLIGLSTMSLPDPLVTSSSGTLGGALVFAGTRVPVKNLFDYLEGGDPLDEFLKQFPTVSRDHAIAVLELARQNIDIGRAA